MTTYTGENHPLASVKRFYSDIDDEIEGAVIDIHTVQRLIKRHYSAANSAAVEFDVEVIRLYAGYRLCSAYRIVHTDDKQALEAFLIHAAAFSAPLALSSLGAHRPIREAARRYRCLKEPSHSSRPAGRCTNASTREAS